MSPVEEAKLPPHRRLNQVGVSLLRRWRTPSLIVALAAGAIAYLRLGTEQTAQSKTLGTFGITVLASLLLLLRLFFASGLTRRVRLSVCNSR